MNDKIQFEILLAKYVIKIRVNNSLSDFTILMSVSNKYSKHFNAIEVLLKI